jgi:hypothetical protein
MNSYWTLCNTMILVLTVAACGHRPVMAPVESKHLIVIHRLGQDLYLDRLDNHAVLQQADTAGPTTFCTFLVGWRDSLQLTDAKRIQEKEKYIQYSMQQDWTAVVAGDSVKPVFLQEKPYLEGKVREMALVFEIPRNYRTDTLVYRDTYGTWGTQVFVLNEKQLYP